MPDPISMVLGVAPLCITAIGILFQLSAKIKLLRRHGKEVKQIRKKLKIQRGWFLDEINLLLLDILDYHVVDSMMGDIHHPHWQSRELEESMKSHLGSKHDRFQEILVEAREAMEDILEKLAIFPEPPIQVPLSKSTRNAFILVFKKEEYLDSIETLAESNAEMKMVRKTVKKIKKYREATSLISIPPGYETVQNMSLALYDLLQTKISCEGSVDARHNMKLFLNSTDESNPSINLFFEHTFSAPCAAFPIHASCKDLSYMNSGLSSPNLNSRVSMASKRACIRNTGGDHRQEPTQINSSRSNDHDNRDDEDLAETGIRCRKLNLDSASPSQSSEKSIGFLSIKGNRKLILYPGLQGVKVSGSTAQPAPLIHYLQFDVYDVISDVDRIRLGITLVKSMLKYNSTPWWPQGFTLDQIYVLRCGSQDISSCLDTLHLLMQAQTNLSTVGTNAMTPVTPAGKDCQSDYMSSELVQDAMENYGIRNLTLYCLGVALLEIGIWSSVQWEDHVNVRRMLKGTMVKGRGCFGERYKKAVSKLINCDFGLGIDSLNDSGLQSAIFNDIVGELESLLRLLVI